MLKTHWKSRVLVVALLLATNALSWNRERITRLFVPEKSGEVVDVGVLIPDKQLSGKEAEDILLARSYLSENYHWVCVRRAKVPLPMEPFISSTGFHFQPVSADGKEFQPLASR